MQNIEFGQSLRRLREQAGLTQRQLAEMVGVDFSYLSKIENGVVAPPSEELVLRLAHALGADKDELLALAGKIPSDLAEILRNREVLKSLRKGKVSKQIEPAGNSNDDFRKRLRQLREQAGLSLTDLADRVGVSFTYLSKIENGIKPRPSEKVILKLAEALNCDKDDLMASAGRVPSDIAHILKDRQVRQSLRTRRARKPTGSGIDVRKVFNYMITKRLAVGKQFARVALAFLLVVAVATSLWFSSPTPVRALEIELTNPTDSTTLDSGVVGQTYPFKLKITIGAGELLPIQNINLSIFNISNASYSANLTNLPLANGATATYTADQTGGGTAVVTATTNFTLQYGGGYAVWGGYGYSFPVGYGYGYGGLAKPVTMTYNINWTPPTGWPTGSYRVSAVIAANGTTFTRLSSQFNLALPPSPSPTPIISTLTTSGLSAAVPLQVNESGIVQANALLVTSDQKASFNIPQGTRMLDAQGNRLSAITAATVLSPPPPPSGSAVVLAYDFGPDGATFSPPIALSMTYDPAALPSGTVESSLTIAWWNGTNWVTLSTTVNTATKTLTAQVSHFSKFAVMRVLPAAPVTPPPPVVTPPAPTPAAFTTSGLAISPTTVNIGGQVTISVRVANTGGSSGSYKVTLKINNVAVETKDVTLSGGASQTVTFTTSRDTAGSYTVTIDTLSGTFAVSAPAPTPPPPPPPPAEPIKPAPEKGVAAWVWIVIALAAVVIAVGVIWLVRRRMA